MNQKQLFKKLSILFDLGEHKIKSNLVLKNINSMDSLKQMELISLLEQNVKTVYETIMKAKPASVKGTYLKKMTISSTMGPGIKIDHGNI